MADRSRRSGVLKPSGGNCAVLPFFILGKKLRFVNRYGVKIAGNLCKNRTLLHHAAAAEHLRHFHVVQRGVLPYTFLPISYACCMAGVSFTLPGS